MRYRKNKYRYFYKFNPNRYYNHTFYAHRDKSKDFVRNEFFNLDSVSFKILASKYKVEYGTKAYNYLVETFYKWKSGRVRISDQTIDRILKYVPKLLPINKQYQLLKLEISAFLEKSSNLDSSQSIKSEHLEEYYSKYIAKIHNFNTDDLRWFVKGSFEEEELSEFIIISKYVLEKKLQLSINQVIHDIAAINKYLSSLENLFFHISYKTDLLGINIIVDGENIEYPNVNFKFLKKRFEQNNSHINEIIIDEILNLSFTENQGNIDGVIQEFDLLKIVEKARELNENKREFVIDSNLKGRGGYLNLKLERIHGHKFLVGLFVNVLLIIVNIFLIIFCIYLHSRYKIPKNSGCYIFFGWVAIVWLSGYHILYQLRSIKENLFNFKKYGKRK